MKKIILALVLLFSATIKAQNAYDIKINLKLRKKGFSMDSNG
jgi:hypothetical protein